MIASNNITEAHAGTLLKATRPEQRIDFEKKQKASKRAPIEQIVKLEKEMDQVHAQYQSAEKSYSADLLHLVAEKGYLKRLVENDKIATYIEKYEPDVLAGFERVVDSADEV